VGRVVGVRERGGRYVEIVSRRRIRDVLAVGGGRDPEWEADLSVGIVVAPPRHVRNVTSQEVGVVRAARAGADPDDDPFDSGTGTAPGSRVPPPSWGTGTGGAIGFAKSIAAGSSASTSISEVEPLTLVWNT
jgi:hypothetical protein